MQLIFEAGWGIYPVLAFGLASLVIAGRQIGAPRAGRATTAALLMALTLVSGAMGTVTGLQKSASHIHEVASGEKWIFLVGLSESLSNMVVALALITLTLVALLLAHLRQDPTIGASDQHEQAGSKVHRAPA